MKGSILTARWTLLVAFGALQVTAVGMAAQTPTFTVEVLGNIPGGVGTSVAGINDAGEVVGGAGGGTSACPNYCAVIWVDGTATVLAVEPGFYSAAVAVNNAGQVAGSVSGVNATGAVFDTAAAWNNGTLTLLTSPAPYTNSFATAVNDSGEVVVEAYESNGAGIAIAWNGQTPTLLGPESQCAAKFDGGDAAAIDNGGAVVGLNVCRDRDVATLWQGATATALGGGVPAAINNAGLIVGVGVDGPTAWVNGVATPLQTLPGAVNSTAGSPMAVNNQGVIVGTTRMNLALPKGIT